MEDAVRRRDGVVLAAFRDLRLLACRAAPPWPMHINAACAPLREGRGTNAAFMVSVASCMHTDGVRADHISIAIAVTLPSGRSPSGFSTLSRKNNSSRTRTGRRALPTCRRFLLTTSLLWRPCPMPQATHSHRPKYPTPLLLLAAEPGPEVEVQVEGEAFTCLLSRPCPRPTRRICRAT